MLSGDCSGLGALVMIFRKFSNADVSSIGPVKSSIVRAIRGAATVPLLAARWSDRAQASHPMPCAASLCEQYPYLEETGLIDDFVPKKGALNIAKWYVSRDDQTSSPCSNRKRAV